ncbi:MAG: hypothetical protein IKU10_05275 [Clostridia bacterium]|nr:hypothetical protein [Clostridia bacterium]
MVKRILSALLVATLLCSLFVVGVQAENADSTIMIPASKLDKKFVVDGNLDIWYINEGDQVAANDGNYYQYIELSAVEKTDGVTFYSEPATFSQVWTAWDNDYVYIYVKVWDDKLIDFDPSKHANSSGADSIEIWFDPDPNSQTYNFTTDANGKIIGETKKSNPTDGFYNQTGDTAQGDVQVRLIAYDMERHDYYDKVKPGYNGVNFANWVWNKDNFCTFTFENDPVEVYTGDTVSKGYGVEARFPRRDDSTGRYQFHVAANNSADSSGLQYALATGEAWWMRYDTAWSVDYIDNAPFFNQSAAQLATKGVMYTDSEYNINSAGGKLVNKIAALGNVTVADKAKVNALKAEYDALAVLDQGYVQYKNYDVLEKALEIVNSAVVDPNQEAADAVIAKINAIPTTVTLAAKNTVAAARTAYNALTDTQKGLVTNLSKLTAAEKTIADLEKVEADKAAAKAVSDQIAALPSTITLANKSAVTSARSAYSGLTDLQKTYVTNLNKLLAAEKAIADLEVEEGDKAVAGAVVDKIAALPSPITLGAESAVVDARAAYEQLNTTQQAYVTNLAKLEAAEKAIADLKKIEADKAAAKVVSDKIAALPTTLTAEDKATVQAARTSYSLLTDAQKEYVTNYQKLLDAEKGLAELEATGADKEAAEVVGYLIDAIPETVTMNDQAYLQIVREEYERLNDTQKALVNNYLKLEAAEKAFADMEQAAVDKAAAKAVSDLIAALPKPVSLQDKTAIEAARAAYDGLTDVQKALVYNLQTLAEAEAKIPALEQAAADQTAAKAVSEQIAALPETITAENVANVVAAREAYTALTADQKLLVTNYQALLDAEQAIANLEQNEADKQAADAVSGLIEAIPEIVTLEIKDAVVSARGAYNDLTDLQKALVNNYAKLVETEKAIKELENPQQDPAVTNVIALIDSIPETVTLNDKAAVEAARAAYNALTDAQKEQITNYQILLDAEQIIDDLEHPPVEVVYGDLDGDGNVSAADALEVLKSVVGKTTLTEDQFKAADTDGSGKADAADALNILKKVVGKLQKFPVEE